MTDAPPRIRCLLVEDQALIGMALEAFLEDAGCEVEPLPSGAAALAWLDVQGADVAIVDFMLRDGPCAPLARDLKRRGVPFIVYSGLPRRADMPMELQGVPWIEKPADRAHLMRALATAAPGLFAANPLLQNEG